MFGIRLKISYNALIQLGVITLLIIINYSVVSYYDSDLSEVEKTVDLVESNGTYSQQITLYAGYVLQGQEDYRQKLSDAISKYNEHLSVLRSGGKSPENGSYISPVPQDLMNGYFKPVENLWQNYKRNATVIAERKRLLNDKSLNPEIEEAYKYLKKNNEKLLERNNRLVEGYLDYFDDKQSDRDGMFFTIFIINLFFIVLMFLFIIYNVSRPISKLNEMKTIISEGNFDRTIDYRRNDELGDVGKSINSLFQNLRNATDFILAMGEGKLDTDYQRPEGTDAAHDRLGTALLEMRAKMIEVAEADRQRSWASEGLAKFADIFRAHSDSEDFTYVIISNLVQYVGANQGGLFIVEDEKDETSHLELVAAYAYEKRKYMTKRVDKGEGLVGEAYQEGNLIYVTDVPDDYVNITSGLGEANPRSILLVPLKLNDVVYGVVELASFQEFAPYHIEFVERLGESIASTFASVKTSRQTQKLLRESIQLSEQMKAQEEEMRQNLEELVATQEEVQRKNKLMEEQKEELETALQDERYKVEMLETQQKGLEMKIEAIQEKLKEVEQENQIMKGQSTQWQD